MFHIYIAPQTLVGVICPREVDPEWGFMWNRTSAGSTAGQRCQMLGGGPMVTGKFTIVHDLDVYGFF